MTKFAARFGRTRQDMADSPELHRRLMERYALEHGHDVSGLDEWVMIVSAAGHVAFFPHWFPEDAQKQYDRGWTDRTPLKDPPDPL